MKYKVFSPNNRVIAMKTFDGLDSAYAYYDKCVMNLMTQTDTSGVQMQLEDENGTIIDHGTVVG